MERDDLVTDEGVDEGSAVPDEARPTSATGAPPVGEPDSEQQPAPPLGDIGADGDGQQLALGEG